MGRIRKYFAPQGAPQTGLGRRTMKTAIAVFCCLVLYAIIGVVEHRGIGFRLELPFFACAAAIICMQDTVQHTVATGVARLVGTLFGGIMGIVALVVMGWAPVMVIGQIWVIGAGMVACICVCNLMGYQAASAICCVVFLAVINGNVEGGWVDRVYYALGRMGETAVGVVIALIVNRFTWPTVEKAPPHA